MSYQLIWKTVGSVLELMICDDMHLDSFQEIDSKISEYLEQSKNGIALVIDVFNLRVNPYSVQQIKLSQSYLNSYQISLVIVIDNNDKLNRLTALLLFNLCRPKLHFCSEASQAENILRSSGFHL